MKRQGKASMSSLDSTSRASGRSGTILAETSSSLSLFTWEQPDESAVSGGGRDFDVSCSLQCNSSQDGAQVAIVLGVRTTNPANMLVISFSPVPKVWRLERVENGCSESMQERTDRSVKLSSFVSVLVQVRGNSLSVSGDGKSIFSDLQLPDGSLQGQVGIGAMLARASFRNWKVSSAGQGGQQGSGGAEAIRPVLPPQGKYTGDDAKFVDMIERDILDRKLSTKWEDVAKLDDAKRILQEAVVLPLLMPDVYTGIREPWKGVLLFGPPGRGREGGRETVAKSEEEGDARGGEESGRKFEDDMDAADCRGRNWQDLAGQGSCFPGYLKSGAEWSRGERKGGGVGEEKEEEAKAQTTFFNVGPSTIISKYHGESEKLVRVLFNMARHFAPSTIFLDEIDSIMSARGTQSEHEASRRVKGEVLSQMDGISRDLAGPGKLVMVLSTTNKPWDLDDALLRRLEKRIYVALPDREARRDLFAINLKSVTVDVDVDLPQLAADSEGYSGSDIFTVCREASMAPMRRLTSRLSPQEIMQMKARGELDLRRSSPRRRRCPEVVWAITSSGTESLRRREEGRERREERGGKRAGRGRERRREEGGGGERGRKRGFRE
eukprot:760802-Hanusia_phi.AAC.3